MPTRQRALPIAECGPGAVDDHRFTCHIVLRMRIAVLVKQVPRFEEMELGPDGRLRRDGVDLEMNPYCRRAVSQAVELAQARPGSEIVVLTLGPFEAEDTLREAIAWGSARDVDIRGVLVSDRAFAGSDTLATAQAISAALTTLGPFDLVLTGRNSVDSDTGQVPPEVAELCDLPFLTCVRELGIEGNVIRARCEHDDGWLEAEVHLPALLSCAERLIDPAKVDPAGRAAVPADLIRRLDASDLGPGPWGQDASPTWVGPVKVMAVARARWRAPEAPLADQVRDAVRILRERGALAQEAHQPHGVVAESQFGTPCVMVIAEPNRLHLTREMLGVAASMTGNVLAVVCEPPDGPTLVSWGANEIVRLDGPNVEDDIAPAVAGLVESELPWIIVAPSTAWGREIAGRVAARIGAGLTGDAIELGVDDDHNLIALKPAFGGQLVAAIGYRWNRQIATVRPGVLPTLTPRAAPETFDHGTVSVSARGRVKVLSRTRDDDLDTLAEAHAVIGVGRGISPEDYAALEPLRAALGAELGATRKVTDNGWLPRARQIGITGRSIEPRLFVSIGASGKFNHMVGVRAAGTVLAINPDPDALVFDVADVGIVGDWREVLPLLVRSITASGLPAD
jgi:electron transfer flavoprotein alpha subunit